MPDDRLGAVPVAAVELADGRNGRRRTNYWISSGSGSTRYQVPARLMIVDELPRTPSMKVSQPALRELFERRGVDVSYRHPRRRRGGRCRRRGVAVRCHRCTTARTGGPGHHARRSPTPDCPSPTSTGLCTCTGGTLMHSVELAEYLGISTTIHRCHADRRRQLRAVRRTRGRGDRGRVWPRPWSSSTRRPPVRRASAARKGSACSPHPERLEWETPFGVMLPISAYALAANRHMADLRHHRRTAGPDRRRHQSVGRAEPAGAPAEPDHCR